MHLTEAADLENMVKRPSARQGEELACARRDEILDAATALFAERGYSETDTQTLADHLKVGKGTIYRYFPSKRELFLATVDRVMRRLRETVDASVEEHADPLVQLEQSIRTYLAFFAEHPEFVELLIQERASFKDRKKPTYFEHRERNVVPWRDLFRALIAQGRVRDVPVDRIIDVIVNAAYGTMFTNYFTGPSKPFEEQARDILDILYHGILLDPQRPRAEAD